MGFSCDASHVCTLNAASVDFATALLSGVFILIGAVIGAAVMVGFSAFWHRLP